jgi:hypothetical protein
MRWPSTTTRRLLAGERGQLVGDLLPDAAEALGLADGLAQHGVVASDWTSTLGDDDDRELRTELVALADRVGDVCEVVGDLGDEHGVRTARHTRVERDPAGVATHHLDDDDATVRRGGREQAIDAQRGEVDGGVEPERRGGSLEVVVDRLGHADHPEPALVEVVADRQRTVATDRDERIDAELAEHRDQLVGPVDLDPGPVVLLDRVGGGVAAVRGAEDGAAEVHDAAHVAARQRHDAAVAVLVRVHEAVEAVTDPDDVPPAVAGRERGGRMTAFRPGASPPPVLMAMRLICWSTRSNLQPGGRRGQPLLRSPVAIVLSVSWMPRSISSSRSPARWRRSRSAWSTWSGSRYGKRLWMLRASAGLSTSGSADPVSSACQWVVSWCSSSNPVEHGVAEPDVLDQRRRVVRADREVGLGQHHAHVVDHRPEEGPSIVHLSEQRSSRGSAANDSNAVPAPNQPGMLRRHWLHPNTHGIARRSSIRSEFLRDEGRLPDVQRRDLTDRRDRPEELDEPAGSVVRGAVDEATVRVERQPGQGVHRLAEPVGVVAELLLVEARGLQRRGEQRLEVPARRRRLRVLGGHHLALLGDAQRAVHRAGRLGEDRLVGGPPPRPTVPPRPWKRRMRTPARSAAATRARWARYSSHCEAT